MIHIIIGTKAQLIKMAPIMLRLQRKNIPYNFIFTGQHQETIDDLRENFSIKPPDVVLHYGKDITSVPSMLVWLIKISCKALFFRNSIFQGDHKNNGIVLVHGDTFSTLLGAIMGRIAGFKVAHVESGLRSFDLWNPFPEELTRIITFWLSNIYFCPGKWAVNNLKEFTGIKINTQHNTLLDSLDLALKAKQFSLVVPDRPYCVVTTHRFENLCSYSIIDRNISLIENIAQQIKVVFILHPVTDRKLNQFNLKERLENNSSIEFHPRYDYFNFIQLVDQSEFIVSDGGSNQEESFYMGKPCLLLRKTTERTEGVKKNVVISCYNKNKVMEFVKNYSQYQISPLKRPFSPTETIINYIASQ